MDRKPLGDLSGSIPIVAHPNIPRSVSSNLDRVAKTGIVEVPLSTYNVIVDQVAITQRVVGEQCKRSDAMEERLTNLDLKVQDLSHLDSRTTLVENNNLEIQYGLGLQLGRINDLELQIQNLNRNVVSMRTQIDSNTLQVSYLHSIGTLPDENLSAP